MAESDNESGGGGSNASSAAAAREQDRFLPIANVSRIMKKALPANAKISKEAKETVQECVSEFISFITGEASDKCQREKRKTVNGDDLLWAMATLGFEDYVDPLKLYLQKFRDIEGDKAAGPAAPAGTGAAPAPGGGGGGGVLPSTNSQASQKEGGGGGGGMMMMSMVGQQMYGSSLYHHLNQYQHQHQHQMGMGDGSAGASSTAGIGTRGERI